jgi:hypothetical protein
MARRDQAAVLRQQKEAKQKKLLIVLAPVFLGLAAWQGPPMYKALFAGSPPPPPPPAQTAAVPTDPAAGAPTTQQDGTTPTAPTAGLVDTDPPPTAGVDRLVSFSRFTARDPFKVTVGQTEEPVGTGTDDTGSSGEQATSALLEVNGTSQSVSVGDSFPATDPTFKLVSLTSEKAVVGLVTGTFEGGQDTVDIAVGEQVQLVADGGTSYTIKLVSVGS